MLSIIKENDQKNTIAVLDGVRAIACLSVVAFHISLITFSNHLWQPYPATDFLATAVAYQGGAGVTLFFVLSGFLLFLPFAKSLLLQQDWPSAKRFYLRRAFRILPAYYVSLLAIVLLMHPEYLQLDHLFNLGLFAAFLMDSTKGTYQQINGPFWTLAIEWQYYMLLPLIALALRAIVAHGTLKRRWWLLVLCLGVMMAWGIFSRYAGAYFMKHPTETLLIPRPVLDGILFVTYGYGGKFMEDFAVGMLISSFFVLAQQKAPENSLKWLGERARRYCYWLWGAGIAWLFLMMVWNGNERFHAISFLDALYEPYNWFSEWGLSVGFGLCILALLFGTSRLKAPFEWSPLRWVGLISYGMYMWHLPLLSIFTKYIQPFMGLLPFWAAYTLFWVSVALIIIPFSYGLYLLVERPGIKLGEKIVKRIQQARQAEAAPNSNTRPGLNRLPVRN